VQLLSEEIDNNILLGEYDKEKMQERIAKFKGGVAIIKAGGPTDLVMSECRDRIEDTVFAVRAALGEGVIPGGGAGLL
jgi:chaperonin GroEL